VDSTLARRSAEDRFYMVEDADHMEVCKPPSKEHPSYGLLLQFIIDCREVSFNSLVFAMFYKHRNITYNVKFNSSVRR
jgi:hypothetical protein